MSTTINFIIICDVVNLYIKIFHSCKDYFIRNTRKESTHALLYSNAADALFNVYKYYEQFLDHNTNALNEFRRPIEKELKQFVKIASWKDVNIHALKQSAQKTHRQLSKCVRKYKEIEERLFTPC